MKKTLSLLAIILFFLSANAQHATVVRKTAEAMLRAKQKKEYALYTSYFYPTELKFRGGKAKWIKQMQINDGYDAQLPPISRTEVLGKISKVYKAGKQLHCLIDRINTFSGPEGKSKNISHFLAISDDQGKTWKFIMTGGKTPSQVWSMVPVYNENLTFVDYSE